MINADICATLMGYCGYNTVMRMNGDIIDRIIVNKMGLIWNNVVITRYNGDIEIEYSRYKLHIMCDFVMKTYKYRDICTYIRRSNSSLDYVYQSRRYNIYIYLLVTEIYKYYKLEIVDNALAESYKYYYYGRDVDAIYDIINRYSMRYLRRLIEKVI